MNFNRRCISDFNGESGLNGAPYYTVSTQKRYALTLGDLNTHRVTPLQCAISLIFLEIPNPLAHAYIGIRKSEYLCVCCTKTRVPKTASYYFCPTT